jgi:hypothetical protein
LERLPQRIEEIDELLARSISAFDQRKETVVSVKAIARALERQNRELLDTLRQQRCDF